MLLSEKRCLHGSLEAVEQWLSLLVEGVPHDEIYDWGDEEEGNGEDVEE